MDERVKLVFDRSQLKIDTFFNRCTTVHCILPSGLIIVESHCALTEEDYDLNVGISICIEKIKLRIRELEGYVASINLAVENLKELDQEEVQH